MLQSARNWSSNEPIGTWGDPVRCFADGIATPAAASPVSADPLVKRIWLLLCAEGGRWDVSEIRRELALSLNHQHVLNRMGEMARRGFVICYRSKDIDGKAFLHYGVTKQCKVPRGVMWGEIEQYMAPQIVRVKPDNSIRGKPKPKTVAVVRG